MENRGQIFIFENLEGLTGVLTFTHDEHSNLTRFSDFMVIDGTNIPNSLNWVTIPISLQGNNDKLLSDGVAFTSYESKDFYCWLILHLLMINQRLKVIISDEDNSICTVADEFFLKIMKNYQRMIGNFTDN